MGRFSSRDPLGEAGGINLYAYVGNDPINMVDPLGLWAVGINFELSTINPFTSGGGGAYGYNVEYTSYNGVAVYRVKYAKCYSFSWIFTRGELHCERGDRNRPLDGII